MFYKVQPVSLLINSETLLGSLGLGLLDFLILKIIAIKVLTRGLVISKK